MNNFARPLVVKVGGNAMDAAAEASLAKDIAALITSGRRVVLVHGGGPEIDAELARLAIATRRVDGLRVTDEAGLAVTERVLCGTVNKRLVRALLAAGVPAVGVSGIDGPLLHARAIDRDRLGYVGRIVRADPVVLVTLLHAGYVPVVAPLGFDEETSSALNVNADTSAAAIASALQARDFVLLTNVNRVRRVADDARSGIDRLSFQDAQRFVRTPACQGSMLPKIQAAIDAIAAGVSRAFIGDSPISEILQGHATIVEP